MAVTVIQPPHRYRATCGRCGAVLEYLGADIIDLPAGSSRLLRKTKPGIKCPECTAGIAHIAPQPEAQPTEAAQPKRCQHCIDRNDGFLGSWAPDCPIHNSQAQKKGTAS